MLMRLEVVVPHRKYATTRQRAMSGRVPAGRWGTLCLLITLIFGIGGRAIAMAGQAELTVGLHATEITPQVGPGHKKVWLAGYGWGRAATGVRDPLFARAVVLHDLKQDQRVALISVDLIGLPLPEVEKVRTALPEYDYVLVSSTHNHEGPDTIGIWGKTPFQRGVNPDYLNFIVDRMVATVRAAEKNAAPATAKYGTARDASLVDDNRKPIVKDDVLRTLVFEHVDAGEAAEASKNPIGILVQWNCHPEAMGSKNTLITADFCHAMIKSLESQHRCPVAYFAGAVGGLMAPPDDRFRNEEGRILKEGEFEYTDTYGRAVADLANTAIAKCEPVQLVPFRTHVTPIAVPVENALYRTARRLGVLRRKAVHWTGDFHDADQYAKPGDEGEFAVRSEVGCLKLGDVSIGCIPGELYPELVYGQFQDPVETNADFADAPLEPHVEKLFGSKPWLLFGLANDEIGYIIPKRQWDAKPPFAYGRSKPQYGEVNSCGSMVAPIVMQALRECVDAVNEQ